MNLTHTPVSKLETSLADLEPIYETIAAAQARLIAKGSCLDGLYSVGILLQYISGIKRQIIGLKDELAEQEKQKLTLIRELAASEDSLISSILNHKVHESYILI